MKLKTKISIIVATYNSAKTVSDTISSILSQTYHNIEVIVQDGMSSDDTLDIVRSYKDDRVKIYQDKDTGIYDAMNKGLAKATGDIIGILNSDDFYTDNKVLEDIISTISAHDADTIYADLRYVDQENTTKTVRNWRAGKMTDKKWHYGWMPPHPTFFVKKWVYEKYGLFNLGLRTSADYELMLRLLYKHKLATAYLDRTIINMRTGGQSNASIKNRMIANAEDRQAWIVNQLKPRWYTTYLKPIRKIKQYIIK